MKLNKELLKMDRDKVPKDPKDRRIYKLERAIKDFKKYDAKRTAFLHKIQDELELYSQKYLDLKEVVNSDSSLPKLEEKILSLKANLKAVNSKYCILKNRMKQIDNSELLQQSLEIIKHSNVIELNKQIEKLKKEIELLRKSNSMLIIEIERLHKKLVIYES